MNLLPLTEKELVKRGLKRRFEVTLLFLIMLAFLIGLILIYPSYFLTQEHLNDIEMSDSQVKAGEQESDKTILALPSEIDSKLKFLQSNESLRRAVPTFSKIINVLPQKIKVDTLAFNRSAMLKGKSTESVVLSGTAEDRSSLVAFVNVLKSSPDFASVDVPVTSLTKDKDLPFSVTIVFPN